MNGKTAIAVIITALIGSALGVAVAALRVSQPPWSGEVTVRAGAASNKFPKLAVDQIEYDFGKMDVDDKGEHEFVFTNKGDAVLTLTAGDTSCRCTLAEIKEEKLPPGASTKVKVTWQADDYTGKYRQTAKIESNDPALPVVELVVSGTITESVTLVPKKAEFTQLGINETATREVRLLCILDEPMRIVDYVMSNRKTAELFDVSFDPLPEDQLGEVEDAKSGLIARVTIKPGLPSGAFEQTILARTNLDAYPAVDIPIVGEVVSEITIVGRSWDSHRRILDLGTIDGHKGERRQLLLVVRGPHSKEVKFTPLDVEPKSLKVEVGETKPIGEGKATQTPLLIEIPQGTPPTMCLGTKKGDMGRIVIETNHPDVPKLQIPVRFAVEN